MNSCASGQACVLGQCASGWSAMSLPPSSFVAREKAAYVAFGTRVFVFGGADASGNSLGDAAIYDPTTNQWNPVSIDANAPSPRRLATAVWTGSVIVVYGGQADDASAGYFDAAAYDPAADSWTTLGNASTGRVAPIGAASATEVVMWGGWGAASALVSGLDRMGIPSDNWQSGSTVGDPGALDSPAWAFTGQYLYLFGGRLNGTTKTNQAWSFSLASNSWSNLPAGGASSAPVARWGAFGVWDTTAFHVWGGRDETSVKNDGRYYYGGSWTALSQTGAPSARFAPTRQSGWAFARASGDIIFIGGQDLSGNFMTNGGRYVLSTHSTATTWTLIPNWPSGEFHQWGVAAYVAGSLIIWGGRSGTVVTATGDRWSP